MTEQETSESARATPEQEAPIPFKQFLEAVHPSVAKDVSHLWSIDYSWDGTQPKMTVPELRLYCQQCDGERTFRSDATNGLSKETANVAFTRYLCGDCREYTKSFALLMTIGEEQAGVAYKYGEHPPFGVPVPNKVLRLFGEDRDNFLKGRQCENQGLGVGAFAYYRRVVENHKNEIFDEIIKVCETVGASQGLIGELARAKKEPLFTKAIEQIKTALPQGLLISGHNPLLALHNALSIGLHNESDARCLEAARDVRLVLTDLIEKMSLLRQEKSELDGAVQRLIAKKGGASGIRSSPPDGG
jgi:hypothetical protein